MEIKLYSIAQIRQLEKVAIEQFAVSESTLMTRAGQAACHYLRLVEPNVKSIMVIGGPGNNGGDGFVFAKCAFDLGLRVNIRTMGDGKHYSKAAQQALAACQSANIEIKPFDHQESLNADYLIDAILGIGISKPVEGEIKEVIQAINASSLPVLAIDVPSGINADTGSVMGIAVRARYTVTFIGLKQGLFTNDAVDYCGTIMLKTLDLPSELYKSVVPSVYLLDSEVVKQTLLPRKKNSNKGNFGHVLIVGGNLGMAGAVRLAAEAALRVGAGLVSVATLPQHQSVILSQYPEIMCHGIEHASELAPLLKRATAVLIGPGLGKDSWAETMLEAISTQPLPVVVDADALNLLGAKPDCLNHWLLTPHPGEAGRLLDSDSHQIQADRFKAIEELVNLGGTWILKGAGSLVRGGEGVTSLCPYGNPGMASGGMGDALSGILVGLLAQGCSTLTAAKVGTLIHALAGDQAATQGERGLLASDLIGAIRQIINH